jgi:hypothetical protein
MFRAMKTSGFNLEDTHLTDLERISKLIALIAVAFVWVYRADTSKQLNITIINKNIKEEHSASLNTD